MRFSWGIRIDEPLRDGGDGQKMAIFRLRARRDQAIRRNSDQIPAILNGIGGGALALGGSNILISVPTAPQSGQSSIP